MSVSTVVRIDDEPDMPAIDRIRLLIVETDHRIHDYIAAIATPRGFEVLHAWSAADGAEAVARVRPELVIAQELPAGFRADRVFAPGSSEPMEPMLAMRGAALVLHKPILPLAFGQQLLRAPAVHGQRTLTVYEELGILHLDYARRMPDIVTQLATAIQTSCASLDLAACKRLRTQAHRLRGAAGSYGFAQVGLWAGGVEEALRVFLERPSETNPPAALELAGEQAIAEDVGLDVTTLRRRRNQPERLLISGAKEPMELLRLALAPWLKKPAP